MGVPHHKRGYSCAVLFSCGVCVWAMPASAQDVLYHAVRMPALPGARVPCNAPWAINNLGQISGDACWGGSQLQAYRWDPRTGILGLGFFPGAVWLSSGAEAISNLGHIAGDGYWMFPEHEAFWWSEETGMIPAPRRRAAARGANIGEHQWASHITSAVIRQPRGHLGAGRSVVLAVSGYRLG